MLQPSIKYNYKHSKFLNTNVLSLNIVFYTEILDSITLHVMVQQTAPPIPTNICWFFCCMGGSPRIPNIQLLPGGLSSFCVNSLWLTTESTTFPLSSGSLNGYVTQSITLTQEMLGGDELKLKTKVSAIASGCPWFCLARKNVVGDAWPVWLSD